MNLSYSLKLFVLFAALCCFFSVNGVEAAQEGESVAILPFALNAPADKQYLQEGLRDMLGSRMRAEAGADILSKKAVDSQLKESGGKLVGRDMADFARKVGADYLVYGSITALGAGISIDAQVFSAKAVADESVKSFYGSAATNDQIMHSIDSLSWDIIENLFGKQRPAAMVQVQQAAPEKNTGTSGFTTAHPEKAFLTSGGSFGIRSTRNFVKTRNFDMGIQGIELGDVDGDGQEEVIVAENTKVHVFKRNGTRLNSMGSIEMYDRYQVHNVNAADFDGDGKAEIYISAADPKMPGSRAVQWDGSKFVDLFREVRWYIRPMDVPGIGLSLVGQAAGMVPVEPGIYLLSTNGGKVSSQERLPIPAKINLFNFAYADLDGDGQKDLVALDESFKLQVIRGGSTVWKSEERFCGTKRYLGGSPDMMPNTSLNSDDVVDGVGELYKQTYVPSRILVSDVDQDGVDDVILNRNSDSLAVMTPRSRQYTSGTLVGLKWNGLGLEEMWRTRKIDSYVVDYQVKSHAEKLAQGETDELFIGLVLNAGTFDSLLGDQSTVVIYPFEFEKPETK